MTIDDNDSFGRSLVRAHQIFKTDDRFRNEEYPAWIFLRNSAKYLGAKVADLRSNSKDPPDFFVNVDGREVCLEVTSLGIGRVFQRNRFFGDMETILKPLIEKNLAQLPLGRYFFHYFPGTLQET